jgi:uncharacterized protein
MRRNISALVAAMLVLVSCAGGGRAILALPGRETPQPAVWAVCDSNSIMYLYGSMHLRRRGAAWGGPTAEAALAHAAEVWTEIDLDKSESEELRPLLQQLGFNPSGGLLAGVPPDYRVKLEAAATRVGASLQAFDNLRPWLISLTISMGEIVRTGYEPAAGVDRAIHARSVEAGKRLRWLETPEQQLRFLADLPDPVQMEMLYETLDQTENAVAQLARMERAWEIGDTDALADLIMGDKERFPELYFALFTRRNEAWAETLAAEMDGAGEDFVVVGAGHLIGQDSLIQMLRDRGFKVVRLTKAPD